MCRQWKQLSQRSGPCGAPCMILHLALMNSFKLFCVKLGYSVSSDWMYRCTDRSRDLYSFLEKATWFQSAGDSLERGKGSIRLIMAKTKSYPSMSTKNDVHFKCSHTHASCARTFTVVTWRSTIPVSQGMHLDRWKIIVCWRSFLSRRLSYPQMSVSIQLPNFHV